MQAEERNACRWIHRATLKKGGVEMVGGVQYEKVDDDGLHVKVGRERRVRLEDVFLHRPVLQPAREATVRSAVTTGFRCSPGRRLIPRVHPQRSEH